METKSAFWLIQLAEVDDHDAHDDEHADAQAISGQVWFVPVEFEGPVEFWKGAVIEDMVAAVEAAVAVETPKTCATKSPTPWVVVVGCAFEMETVDHSVRHISAKMYAEYLQIRAQTRRVIPQKRARVGSKTSCISCYSTPSRRLSTGREHETS